jgi:hypothetical protein
MTKVLHIIVGLLLLVAAVTYFMLGLYLTGYGTPVPIMHGLGQWMIWALAPVVIGAICFRENA